MLAACGQSADRDSGFSSEKVASDSRMAKWLRMCHRVDQEDTVPDRAKPSSHENNAVIAR